MSPDEKKIVRELLLALQRKSRISKEELVNAFPGSIESGKLSNLLFEEVCSGRNPDEMSSILRIGSAFGFLPEQKARLIELLNEDWHESHEDIVDLLRPWQDPVCISPLYKTALTHYEYRDYDESESLAVKCIWALKKNGGKAAREKLELLSQSNNDIIRSNAKDRLRDLEGENGDRHL